MKNTIRNTLLITAAATALVGAGLASAQGVNDRREAPPAAAHEQKAPEGKTEGKADQQPGSSRQKSAAPTAQAPGKSKPTPTAQAPEKPADSKPQTTGQGGAAQPSQSSKEERAPAPAALSTEQHVKIRDTLRGEKVEHLNSVQFSTTVGEAVPRTVHLFRFPASVIAYAPQYRDFEYLLVGDDVLVVDPRTMRIVAVIPA
jgi:hypothetical protein